MIDKKARQSALKLLTDIENKKITNWQLEDRWPSSKNDPAINCILRWIWNLYDDDKEVILSEILNNESQKIMKRCQEFLSTDIEFLVSQPSKEESKKIKKEWGKEWRVDCTFPDDEFWPFPSK